MTMLITGSSEAVIHDTKKVLHKKNQGQRFGRVEFFSWNRYPEV